MTGTADRVVVTEDDTKCKSTEKNCSNLVFYVTCRSFDQHTLYKFSYKGINA